MQPTNPLQVLCHAFCWKWYNPLTLVEVPMMKLITIVFLALGLCPILSAKEIAVGSLPSDALDSEVWTNVAFNAVRDDVRDFVVRIELASSVSNCIQVALGRDLDGDGDLTVEESALVIGFRDGRCFVEDVAGEDRHFESSGMSGTGPCFLQMSVRTDASLDPKNVSFATGSGPCFQDLASACPPWLFRREWNLLKVTRRGDPGAQEICRVRADYRSFRITIR